MDKTSYSHRSPAYSATWYVMMTSLKNHFIFPVGVMLTKWWKETMNWPTQSYIHTINKQ